MQKLLDMVLQEMLTIDAPNPDGSGAGKAIFKLSKKQEWLQVKRRPMKPHGTGTPANDSAGNNFNSLCVKEAADKVHVSKYKINDRTLIRGCVAIEGSPA